MTKMTLKKMTSKILETLKTKEALNNKELTNLLLKKDLKQINKDWNTLLDTITDIETIHSNLKTFSDFDEIFEKVLNNNKKLSKKRDLILSDINIKDFNCLELNNFFSAKASSLKLEKECIEYNKTLSYSEKKREHRYNKNQILLKNKEKIIKKLKNIDLSDDSENLKVDDLNICKLIKENPFNKQKYTVNVDIKSLNESFSFFMKPHNEPEEKQIIQDFLEDRFIPNFQRDNNKWSKEMQVKFVENIIKGYHSNIKFYRIRKFEDKGEFILDGLQRLTAIQNFLKGELRIFGEVSSNGKGYNYFEIITTPELLSIKYLINRCNNILFDRYEFEDLREVIEFYIETNENISHSPEDIQKAKDYLLTITEEDYK